MVRRRVDAFIAALCLILLAVGGPGVDAAGIAPHLQYRVTLSGSLDDVANAIASDAVGNVYVAGVTTSSDFPTLDPAQSHLAGGDDAWVAGLDTAGHTRWSTYLGGSRNDQATGIALDAGGDVWVTGWTESSDFPVTAGALQHSIGGGVCPVGGGALPCSDAFVAEFSSRGALLYSTYLGGDNNDAGTSIAAGGDGRIGVVGWTQSLDFPIHSALQQSIRSSRSGQICPPTAQPPTPCPDAFIIVLAPGGRSLLYSTFLGGSETDQATGIAFDVHDDAFLTGWTESADFPTSHAIQRHIGGPCRIFPIGSHCPDAFVAELDPTGMHLVSSTYLGGRGVDEGNGIAVDQQGAAYVVGLTTSTNFPRVRPLQLPHPKGGCTFGVLHTTCSDMFLAKLEPGGRGLAYSSHFGGDSLDVAQSVAVDPGGTAYVAGHAGSYNFPLLHPLQARTGGGFDAAIVAVTPGGNKARFSTYYGGQGDDDANGVAASSAGAIYVAGELDSTRYTKTNRPFRGQDALIMKIMTGSMKPRSFPCVPRYMSGGAGCPKKGSRNPRGRKLAIVPVPI